MLTIGLIPLCECLSVVFVVWVRFECWFIVRGLCHRMHMLTVVTYSKPGLFQSEGLNMKLTGLSTRSRMLYKIKCEGLLCKRFYFYSGFEEMLELSNGLCCYFVCVQSQNAVALRCMHEVYADSTWSKEQLLNPVK